MTEIVSLNYQLLDPNLGGIFGQKKMVRDIISFNVRSFRVQKYKIGLQTFTFILKNINGIKKIIYIQNLEKDFFSEESEYNIDYIKNLKVECVKNFKKEYRKIRLCSRTFQSKYIEN
jgi:hypothetical protein